MWMCGAVPADCFRRGGSQWNAASLANTLEAAVEAAFLGAGGAVVRFVHAAEVRHEEVFAVELVVARRVFPLSMGVVVVVVVAVLTRTGTRSWDAGAEVAAPDLRTQVLG